MVINQPFDMSLRLQAHSFESQSHHISNPAVIEQRLLLNQATPRRCCLTASKSMECKYTPKQGQYLSFIYYYTRLNGYPPAEADMQRYFKVTPPTVHNMVVTLEKLGLIDRVQRQPRTIRVLLPKEELPDLE